MTITVFRHARVRGYPRTQWPALSIWQRGYAASIATVMNRQFSTDAHYVQYSSPVPWRLRNDALGDVVATMGAIVLDIDCPSAHREGQAVPKKWRTGVRARVCRLLGDIPGGYYHETRGGARLVYASHSVIACAGDAQTWRRYYATVVCHVQRVYGIEADIACADWTRMFRCPRANREGVVQQHIAFGDADVTSEFTAKLTDEDIAAAQARLPAAWPSPPRRHPRTARRMEPSHPYGEFYAALQRNGDIFRGKGDGWVIRCPNSAQHGSGRDGDTSTILYAATTGSLGHIHCKHAHCQRLTPRDWARLLGIR